MDQPLASMVITSPMAHPRHVHEHRGAFSRLFHFLSVSTLCRGALKPGLAILSRMSDGGNSVTVEEESCPLELGSGPCPHSTCPDILGSVQWPWATLSHLPWPAPWGPLGSRTCCPSTPAVLSVLGQGPSWRPKQPALISWQRP
jgi:hypothetical protein